MQDFRSSFSRMPLVAICTPVPSWPFARVEKPMSAWSWSHVGCAWLRDPNQYSNLWSLCGRRNGEGQHDLSRNCRSFWMRWMLYLKGRLDSLQLAVTGILYRFAPGARRLCCRASLPGCNTPSGIHVSHHAVQPLLTERTTATLWDDGSTTFQKHTPGTKGTRYKRD